MSSLETNCNNVPEKKIRFRSDAQTIFNNDNTQDETDNINSNDEDIKKKGKIQILN